MRPTPGRASLALVGLWLLVTLPGLGYHYAYEWDSVQLALGAEEWSLPKHQPHPFGFPLWILLLKILRPVFDPLLAQRILSLAFTCAGLWMLFLLVREALGRTSALAAAALTAWGPPVRMLAVAQSAYPVDFFGSGLAGWLAIRVWRGDARSAFWLPVLVALLGAVRSSSGTFLAPFVGASLLLYLWRTRRWLPVLSGAAVGAAITAAWIAAVIQNAGGLAPLRKLSQGTFGEAMKLTSVFHGAPWWALGRMMELSAVWIAFAAAGLLAPLCLWLLLGKMWKRLPSSAPTLPPPFGQPLFYLLWAGPTLIAIFFVHGPKPGYQMLALPALVLALAIGVWRFASRVVSSESQWAWTTLALGCAAALGLTWIPYGHLLVRHHYWFESFRAMPQVHADIDRNMEAIFRLLDQRGPGAILLFERSTFESPNTRVIEYHRRGLPHASVRRLGFEVLEGFDILENGVRRQSDLLPPWVHEVLIVMHGYDPSWDLRAKYPLMRRAYHGPFMQIWLAPYR